MDPNASSSLPQSTPAVDSTNMNPVSAFAAVDPSQQQQQQPQQPMDPNANSGVSAALLGSSGLPQLSGMSAFDQQPQQSVASDPNASVSASLFAQSALPTVGSSLLPGDNTASYDQQAVTPQDPQAGTDNALASALSSVQPTQAPDPASSGSSGFQIG